MSLADQAKLNDLANKFDGRTPIRVFFLDNSSKVFLLNARSTTVKELLKLCLEKAGVQDIDFVLPYFGIFESKNGGAIDNVLSMEGLLQDTLTSWKDNGFEKTAKFLFMIRLYLPSINGLTARSLVAYQDGIADAESLPLATYLLKAEVTDEAMLHVQFMQAVYHVITGQLPVNAEEGLTLGALHFLLKFGRFSSTSHKPGFLGNRIFEFVPMKLLKQAGSTLPEWEQKLLQRVEKLSASTVSAAGNGNSQQHGDEDGEASNGEGGGIDRDLIFIEGKRRLSPLRKYLDIIYAMPLFGLTLFKCTQRSTRGLPDTVYLGIHADGIRILDKTKKTLRDFHIEELFRWGFKPNSMYYFEVSAENELGTGTLEFDTDKGKVISDLMTDFALAFLKEREREEERMKKLPPLPKPSKRAGEGVLVSGSAAHLFKGKSAEFRAAARIQAAFRGFSLRSEWVKEDAAILIQSMYRGYRARVFLSEMIEQMIQNGEL